ncbi:MAG: hypothetical protein ING44_03550 [Telmatospirillum sp.]|nr:hypothetical protein [Telmatospirillum sp.]
MKAGSAGSNPDGATIKNKASVALKTLLNDIGNASFNLNTIVVGLDAVEHGHRKPNGLNVSWDPKEPVGAARTARKFAVESSIVTAAEVLKAYVSAIAVFPRFEAIRSEWRHDTGSAKKLYDIGSNVLGKDEYLVAGGMLLISWRNRIIHNGDFKFNKTPEKGLLMQREAEIAASYGGLSVDRMICHVLEDRPTLKDVSSLIAMSINLARRLDEKIYTSLTKEEVIAWIKYYRLAPMLKKVEANTSPERLPASIEHLFRTHASGLYSDYKRLFGDTVPEIN